MFLFLFVLALLHMYNMFLFQSVPVQQHDVHDGRPRLRGLRPPLHGQARGQEVLRETPGPISNEAIHANKDMLNKGRELRLNPQGNLRKKRKQLLKKS